MTATEIIDEPRESSDPAKIANLERYAIKAPTSFGVNWTPRRIGKRDPDPHKLAVHCAEQVEKRGARSPRWIPGDARRELNGEATIERLRRKRG